MNEKMKTTIETRQEEQKNIFLDHLRKIPIMQYACDRAEVSRITIYRWRKDSEEFAQAVDEAIAEGLNCVTDLSELQLVNLVRERKMAAISLWLKVHHATYKSGGKSSSANEEPFALEIINYNNDASA